MEQIQAPQINLNGTDKASLLEQYQTAYLAAKRAVDMLRLCAPHGRDYQTLPADLYDLARGQHQKRMRNANAVANELMDIIEQIQEQGR